MSFRTREYYKEDWDQTGIDLAFWNGHEKSDLAVRFIIIALMSFDSILLINSIIEKLTEIKVVILTGILFLILITFPLRNNLTILHLEYKRIDIFTYKTIPFFKPILRKEKSVYLKDFDSASLNKRRFRISPHWELRISFTNPNETVKIPFRANLPYRVHHVVYYGFKKKCSNEIVTSLEALRKFYPYLKFQKEYRKTDFRYLVLLSYLICYFIFSLIMPILVL